MNETDIHNGNRTFSRFRPILRWLGALFLISGVILTKVTFDLIRMNQKEIMNSIKNKERNFPEFEEKLDWPLGEDFKEVSFLAPELPPMARNSSDGWESIKGDQAISRHFSEKNFPLSDEFRKKAMDRGSRLYDVLLEIGKKPIPDAALIPTKPGVWKSNWRVRNIPGDMEVFKFGLFLFEESLSGSGFPGKDAGGAVKTDAAAPVTAEPFLLDTALTRVSLGYARSRGGRASLLTGMIFVAMMGQLETQARKIYTAEDFPSTPNQLAAMKQSLDMRVGFISLFPEFAEVIETERFFGRDIDRYLDEKFPFTSGLLNFIYGNPFRITDTAIEIVEKSASMGHETAISRLGAWERKMRSMVEGSAISRIFRIHPLVGTIFPNYSGIFSDYSDAIAGFRLTTLAGLSRIFSYEQGRWPDRERDGGFFEKAGLACMDPRSGKPFCMSVEDGELMLASPIEGNEAPGDGMGTTTATGNDRGVRKAQKVKPLRIKPLQ